MFNSNLIGPLDFYQEQIGPIHLVSQDSEEIEDLYQIRIDELASEMVILEMNLAFAKKEAAEYRQKYELLKKNYDYVKSQI